MSTNEVNRTPALLWNGLIGVRIGPRGTGMDANDVPLPAFKIDGRYADREDLEPQPNPLIVIWEIAGVRQTQAPLSAYRQALDLRTGVLDTRYETPQAVIRCETVMNPHQRAIGQRWTLTPKVDAPFRMESIAVSPTVAPDSAKGTPEDVVLTYADPVKERDWGMQEQVRLSHRLWGAEPTWRNTGKGFLAEGRMRQGEPVTLLRTASMNMGLGAYTVVDKDGAAELKPGPYRFLAARAPRYEDILHSSRKTWAERWTTDIEIDGPVEDQLAVRAFFFYLRSAIHPTGGRSISPFGLAEDRYGGHVFWDADTWVFPALALTDPQAAFWILNYRTAFKHPPTPWEAWQWHWELARPEMRKHLHQNGDTARALSLGAALGLVDAKEAQAALAAASQVFKAKARGDSLPGVLGPDEYRAVDNDLYTNLLANWCANGGTWDGPNPYRLPRDGTSLLTSDDDELRGYQQASAVLSIYPLQFPEAERTARAMMERFPPLTSRNGPAMTDAIHATIWARMGEADRAYAEWRGSWQAFTRPFLLFSETRSGTHTGFTTGMAGSLQTVLYGFLGFRIDSKTDQSAVWSLKLRGENWLSVKPQLPQAWKEVRFKNFSVLGRTYSLTANAHGATVTGGGS